MRTRYLRIKLIQVDVVQVDVELLEAAGSSLRAVSTFSVGYGVLQRLSQEAIGNSGAKTHPI